MPSETFPIAVHHRPRRVGFLVDLGQEAVGAVLDAIRDFNMEAWGGRFNPIIPLVDGSVSESYLTLLDVADPDVFYAYGELAPTAIEQLHFRYSPTLIVEHKPRPPLNDEAYRVDLSDQASTDGLLNNILDFYPSHFRRPAQAILELEHGLEEQLSRFFRWNIGYSCWNSFAIRDYGVQGCKPESASDADLLKLLNSKLDCAWQIHVIGNALIDQIAGNPRGRPLRIYFGPSPLNLVAYWNDALFTGCTAPTHPSLQQLWLPPEVSCDSAAMKELMLLVQKNSPMARSQGILLVSYDTPVDELARIGTELVRHVRGVRCLSPEIRRSGEFEAVSQHGPENPFRRSTDVHYVIGKNIHLPIQPPSHLKQSSQVWMADLQIFDPTQELEDTNAETWWCLPRNPSISGLFNRYISQRVTRNGEPSFEVAGANPILHLTLPDSRRLFQQLLGSEMHFKMAMDRRSSLDRPPQYEVALSDKGMYFSGVLKLCRRFHDMQYLFEHPFWRSVLLKLSTARPSDYATDKLMSMIAKELPRVVEDPCNDTVKSWLSEQILLAGKNSPHVRGSLTYSGIERLHQKYMSQLSEDRRQFAEPQDLKSTLSWVTEKEILFHGAELRCPNCILKLWYSVAEMKRTVVCRGCQHVFPLPAEPEWSYRLNELVSAGVGNHGLMAVVRTAARIFEDTRSFFAFTPGANLINWYTDNERPKIEHEVDFAWIKDGRLGIAEVKTNTKLFSLADYDSLGKLSRMIRPDVVLISAPDGKDGDLKRGEKALNESLSGTQTEVLVWGPSKFQNSVRSVI
jgi:hypothetical protein